MIAQQYSRVLHALSSSAMEFWLPLPILGLFLWLSGSLVTAQVLSRPYSSMDMLQADTQLELKLAATVLLITVDIDSTRGMTKVAVKTTDSSLKRLEYEFADTETVQIEQAIAQELGMPIERVRRLARYRIL